MNEVSQNDSEKGQVEPLAGERLAAARQSLNISITDVAKELHLDEPKVLALEENRFEDFGAPVFAKGHMRKYAELVGVSFEDLLVDYYQLNRTAGAPPVIGPRRRPPRDISLGPWLTGITVVIVAVSGLWWWFSREPVTDQAQADIQPAVLAPFAGSAAQAPAEGSPDAGDEPLAEQQERAEPSSATEQATAPVRLEEQPAALGQPDMPDIPAADLLQLNLSFTGDCWTEVTDAGGKRLYFDLGVAGGSASISGMAPFRVLLGNSGNVSLVVDGAAYAIPPSQLRGNTAKLTINKQ